MKLIGVDKGDTLGSTAFDHEPMKSSLVSLCASLLVLAGLGGCAAPTPVVDKTRFAPPKSVVIVEPARMRNNIAIGQFVNSTIMYPLHFSPALDDFFVFENGPAQDNARLAGATATNNAVTGAVVGGISGAAQGAHSGARTQGAVGGALVGGLMGGLIDAKAQDTIGRMAQFDQEFNKRVPGLDLRKDLVRAIVAALEARGIAVSVIADDGRRPVRLYWPAPAMSTSAVAVDGSPPKVDADLLIGLSPVAQWTAGGPLNPFQRQVNIGLVVFDGRTRNYLGSQAFSFAPFNSAVEYRTYTGLLGDAQSAAQGMRDGMLTLVPQIADAISTAPATAIPQPR